MSKISTTFAPSKIWTSTTYYYGKTIVMKQ